MIVYCDGCNKAYHQFCHDPPIRDLQQEEWFCSVCSIVKEGGNPDDLLPGLSGVDLTAEDVCSPFVVFK